jgi:hypothetical protein
MAVKKKLPPWLMPKDEVEEPVPGKKSAKKKPLTAAEQKVADKKKAKK